MLFRPCGAAVDDSECKEPVVDFSESTRCVYHSLMPPFTLPILSETVPSPYISVDEDTEQPEEQDKAAVPEDNS